MSKNSLIFLLGAWTASTIWIYPAGIANLMSGLFAALAITTWILVVIGIINETVKTIDIEKNSKK